MIKTEEIENSTTIRDGDFEYKARFYIQSVFKVPPEQVYKFEGGQEEVMDFAYAKTKNQVWNHFYGDIHKDVKELKSISHHMSSDGELLSAIDRLLEKLEFKE